MSTLNDRDIDMDSDQEDKRAVEPMELEELDGDLDGRKEASGSPELGLAHAPALPTDRQEPANDSHVSQQSEEAPESADFLVDLDGDLVDLPASDPSNFHFDIPMPVFRPFQEPDPTERITRLCIKAISTENFKSYYGKKILGPFDQKFTAIIGPNGCGKSNTIDALLFVFGFRSAKLRAHKLPELIHNSEEHKDCTSAKVTVYFALMQSVSPAENKVESNRQVEEFAVGRSINKQNKSDYFLNGTRSTQHDITAKLREHGVDLDHNRFLILQGEVEQISLMKPTSRSEHEEGMLGYLEDIIGSNRYKKPIEEFEEVLTALGTELEASEAVHYRLRKDLVTMHTSKVKAELYLQREGEFFQLHHLVIQDRLHKLRKMMKDSLEKQEISQKELQQAETQMIALREKEASWKSGQNEITKNVKALKKKADDAAAECVECEKKKAAVEADLKSRKTNLKRLENEIKKLRGTVEELQEKQTTDTTRKAELEESLAGLEGKVNDYQEMFLAAQNEVASSTQEYQAKKKQLEADKAVVVKEQQNAGRLLDCKNIELTSIRRDAIAAEKRVEELEGSLRKAQQEMKELSEQQERDSARLRDIKTEIDACTRKMNDLSNRKNSLQTSMRSKNERLNALKETQRTASVAVTRDAAIQELMRCKALGTIPGIYGRVGDLGAIEKKYAIAISAVVGSGFDRVVVDSVKTSKLCLEQLRRTGKGKANMMVLEQIRGNSIMRNMDAAKTFPEDLPRLFDLVTVQDPDLRPVFYYSLRDALVTDNLDQAVRVGNRFKVATLRGEIMDPSGALSGGGDPGNIEIRIGQNVVSHSSSAGVSNQAEISAIEVELESFQSDLQSVNVEQNDAVQQLSNLKREQDGLNGRISAAAKNLQLSSKLVDSLPGDLQKAEKLFKDFQKSSREEDRMAEEIEQLKAVLADVTDRVDVFSRKIADVDQLIWAVREEKVHDSERKLKKWQAKLDQVNKELRELTAAVIGHVGAVASKEALLKKKEDQIEEVKTKISELLKKQEDTDKQSQTSTAAAARWTDELRDVQASVDHLRSELVKVEEEIEAEETRIAGLKTTLRKIEDVLKDVEVKLKANEPRLDSIQADATVRPYAKPVDFSFLTSHDLEKLDYEKLKREYNEVKSWLEKTKVNLGILPEYEVAKAKYDEHLQEYKTLKTKVSAATSLHKRLGEERTQEFLSSFEVIQSKLKKTYHYLTHGGDAELVPVNNLNVFGDGIEFSVRPPNKSWKSISNLSGGEKTLSSLSLIFALHHYKPTPFYIMDEIDAALDYRNVTIVGKYVKDRALDAQFIIISLRPNMYQQASRHIGIFKVNNVTQVGLLAREAYQAWQDDLTLTKSKRKQQVGKDFKEKEAVRRRFLASIFPKTAGSMEIQG